MIFKYIINHLKFPQKSSVDFSYLFSIKKNRHQLLSLLQKHPTPLFISDTTIIKNRFKQLKTLLNKHWSKNHAIAYSFKTNYQAIKSLKKLGAWAETVSEFELSKAQKLGFPNKEVIFNGPYKPNTALKTAINNKVLIHLDNQTELNRLSSLVNKKKTNVGLRLNPNINDNHFGFSLKSPQTKKAINQIVKHQYLNLISLHCHLGSNISKPSNYLKAAHKLSKLANQLYKNYNLKLKILDLGGGFPSHGPKPFHRLSWKQKSIDQFIKPICQILKKQISYRPLPQLIFEPGRYLVDDSTIFICQIIAQKPSLYKQTLITNGAITMLPLIYYQPPIIKLYSPNLNLIASKTKSTTVYGATCKQDDCLYTGKLPHANINDYLVFYCSGAYNLNLAPEFIFSKPKVLYIN